MSQCKGLLASFGAIGIVTAGAAWSAHAAQLASLQSYNVDINKTSVSGLSSGGYMAVQFEVAFSSMLRGAGVIAGGPYYCAQGNVVAAASTCSCAAVWMLRAQFHRRGSAHRNNGSERQAWPRHDTTNLANHRIWMFSGTVDSVVPQRIMDELFTYYSHYVGAENLSYQNKIAAEHAMPTDYFGNSCPTLDDPFINSCNYDGAGQLLRWIYGDLNPKNTVQLGGALINFNQGEFIDQPNDHGLASDGWLYVRRIAAICRSANCMWCFTAASSMRTTST